MFQLLGQWIARRAVWLVLAWIVTIAVAMWAWRTTATAPVDMGSVLPSDHPWTLSMQRMRVAFPLLNARSQVVVIGYRPSGLTSDDLAWMGRLGDRVESSLKFKTLSPTMSFLRHRLMSTDRQSAMLIVNLPTNFISAASARSTEQVESILHAVPPPPGLTVEITGTAGIGRDYSVATQQALHRTTWVTIVAVLAILILVYRSPVGALVPLVSIGASVFVAFVVLAFLAVHVGWTVSAMERIFAVVLIFGMGVNFALFWIARYREELRPTGDFAASAATATRTTGPAILVSAATTICGLTTMLVTQLTPTQNAGKVLAVALSITLIASLTLAPALARLLGRWLFWPTGYRGQIILGEEIIWPRVAALVTWNPKLILIGGLLVLGIPAIWAMSLEPRYDSISELPPGSSSLRGFNIANTHFKKGQLYSNNIMLDFSHLPRPIGELYRLSQNVSRRIAAIPGVADVYSLDAPLGRGKAQTAARMGAMLAWLGQELTSDPSASSPARSVLSLLPGAANIREMGEYVRQFYLAAHSQNGGAKPRRSSQDSGAPPSRVRSGETSDPDRSSQVLRFEVLIDHLPFSPEAMKLMGQIDKVTRDAVAASAGSNGRAAPEILKTGPTPYILGVRDVSTRDQMRVRIFASIVIAVIVLTLIRDLPLTLFMLLATWLTYGATIAASHLFFVHVMHQDGLDWKVHLIVFVIIVAVGQDYNIFLVSRLLQEPAELSDEEAARRAIVRTGSVISNCGLIMAATLGSLWVGQLGLLRQVGFALALGILMDTFFVRPLLLPSFFLATHRQRVKHRRKEGSGTMREDQGG